MRRQTFRTLNTSRNTALNYKTIACTRNCAAGTVDV